MNRHYTIPRLPVCWSLCTVCNWSLSLRRSCSEGSKTCAVYANITRKFVPIVIILVWNAVSFLKWICQYQLFSLVLVLSFSGSLRILILVPSKKVIQILMKHLGLFFVGFLFFFFNRLSRYRSLKFFQQDIFSALSSFFGTSWDFSKFFRISSNMDIIVNCGTLMSISSIL